MKEGPVGRTMPNSDSANSSTLRWNRAFVACGLAALIVWLAVAPEPPFFSEWESLSVYGTYGAQEGSSDGLIAPFGNIGGLGYSPIELSRSLSNALGLPPTLWSIRLPSLLFGVGSIIILWILGRRIFTPRLAICLTAIVTTAPMFVFYSSELIVVSASFFAFVLFLERLDFFVRHASSIFGWLTLTICFAFSLTLYGPVRIVCTATLALCVCW
ncbi:glycosyltransferase family 39 protein, partial [Actinomycetota bacterium]|nr:glycosyltransferase family 39 protein [Actinomycetota bacterium]